MIKAEFAQLLLKKCKNFIANTKGIFIKVSIKLLLEFPLNNIQNKNRKYFGPNWQYEFERLLRSESDWNENIVDHLISLSTNNMGNINIINTINLKKENNSNKQEMSANCNKSNHSNVKSQNKKKKHKKRHKNQS